MHIIEEENENKVEEIVEKATSGEGIEKSSDPVIIDENKQKENIKPASVSKESAQV